MRILKITPQKKTFLPSQSMPVSNYSKKQRLRKLSDATLLTVNEAGCQIGKLEVTLPLFFGSRYFGSLSFIFCGC